MTIDIIKQKLPESAKDIKLNFTMVLSEDGAPDLTQVQIFSIALACAYTLKNPVLLEALVSESLNILSDKHIEGAKSAASIMAMNNIYYRFIHLVTDKNFATMPAKLRMNVMANPGVEKLDFELMSLAVSALNGCGMCIDSHTKTLEHAGASQLAIQSAVRIAAVLNAVSVGLSL